MEKRGGRRGSYLSVSAEKTQVATYASTPAHALLSSTSARHSVKISRICIGVLRIAHFPLSTPARLQNQCISSDLHVATLHTIITESGLRVRIMNILTVLLVLCCCMSTAIFGMITYTLITRLPPKAVGLLYLRHVYGYIPLHSVSWKCWSDLEHYCLLGT